MIINTDLPKVGQHVVMQLLKFVDDLGRSLDETGQTDVIYLDFAKTFDKYKLNHMYGVKGNTMSCKLTWLSSYLTTRRQRVVLN